MGGGSGGGYSSDRISITQIINSLAANFPLSENGRFGKATKRPGVRVIYSTNPQADAKHFFAKFKSGALEVEPIKSAKGFVLHFANETHVTYRPQSKSGSPAISFNFGNKKDSYKVHFESLEHSK